MSSARRALGKCQLRRAHNPQQSQGGRGRNRGGRVSTGGYGPAPARVNTITLQEESEERAEIYAALDPSGRNRQYSVMEVPVDCQGNPLSLLVDSGSTHSFISPKIVAKLGITPKPIGKNLRASLANGTEIVIREEVVDLEFTLQGHGSSQRFRVMKLGKFQGIIGMDWLQTHDANIHCKTRTISFQAPSGETRKSHLRVVKALKLLKVLRKGLSIYVLKLNNPSKSIAKGEELEWLSEY